jgi:Peptidase family M28/PA domain
MVAQRIIFAELLVSNSDVYLVVMRTSGRVTKLVAAVIPHLVSALLLSLLTTSTAPAQALAHDSSKVPAREHVGFEAIREADLRADLAFIASDGMAGRMSLQPGDDAAAAWVASEFAKAGLIPAATDAAGKPSYLQAVELAEYRGDRAAGVVTLDRAGKRTVWKAPKAFGSYRDNVDLSAPVVFAGFGITSPELGYDDYKGVDAKGRIVLVFDHEPQENDPKSIFNGTGNTRYATTRVKLLNAQAHGAVALVVVAEPNRKHLTNAERAAKIGGSITRANPLPLQALENDELHIPFIMVQDDVAAELLATSGKTPGELQAGIDKDLTIQSRSLPDTSLTIHLRNQSRATGVSYNVAGLLPGSDPKLAGETIIISGHHDHDGQSGKDIWHGADDNGSGTVGVVELAHAFASNAARPKRSILFVVFASEERGLLGSYYMADHPLRPLATTRAMINFDMIGRNETASPQTEGLIEIPSDTTNRLNLIGALYSPDYDRVVKEENKSVGLVLDDRFDHESALNVFFRSDQFPFVLHDVPAFWWFTGFHPDYHHTTDTAEKINYSKMTKILQLAYLTAWRFGDAAAGPKFVPNPGAPVN